VKISDSTILRHIQRQPRQAAALKQLVHELGARGEDRRQLGEHLARLVSRGELVERDGKYAIPPVSRNKNLVTGRLSMHRDGYGFVLPEDDSVRSRFSGDIFVNPSAIGTAMHGDRVQVELGSVSTSGRAEGRIVRVLEREHSTVVGIFHYSSRHNYVAPIDEKIKQDVIIPPGMEVPNAQLDANAEAGRANQRQAHRVVGKEARQKKIEDLEGVVVDVEITDWPTPTQNPRGRVIEVLGYEDDFGVDVEIIIRKHHLPHRFPAEVLDEAESVSHVIHASEIAQRRDYRKTPIVTIDGETARDFDDAVAVRKLENGNYQLQVHIADVAHYVQPGTALDREARLRANSVYFPDRAIPMLPVELSTDICSLRPQTDRLVMSCVMEIDHQGEVAGYELHPGVIRSAERMTYTDVNAILEGDAVLRKRYAPLVKSFELMKELAQILNRKRVRRGSIDFDLPEPVIEFDEQGLMQGVTRSERNFAHRLIEEFMLAANESVASYLEHKGMPALYRIHEKPDPKKVYEFEMLAASFGYSLGVGALPIKRMQLRGDRRMRQGSGRNPREIEIPEDIHVTPRMYQKLTQKIVGKPEERILSFLMLRSLKQARYSEKNVGHFALAAPTYTHFTSPIRRYPDLIVHRILKAVLAETGDGRGTVAHSETPSPWSKRTDGQRMLPRAQAKDESRSARTQADKYFKKGTSAVVPIPEDELHQIAESSSEAERRAADAERELMEWKKIKFMEERIGEDFPGLVVSVTKYGLFVELEDLFIEGLVPLQSLTDDRYTYHENTRQIIGERTRKTYSIGDRVRVIVDRIDRVQRKIQFALVEEQPGRARKQHHTRRR